MTGDTDGAERRPRSRALRDRHARCAPPTPLASAATNRGALLALGGHPARRPARREHARYPLRAARELATAAAAWTWSRSACNYESLAEPTSTSTAGSRCCTRACAPALAHGATRSRRARLHQPRPRCSTATPGFDELEAALADGLAFTEEHGFPSHAYNLAVHGALLALRRGDWAAAEAGLAAPSTRPTTRACSTAQPAALRQAAGPPSAVDPAPPRQLLGAAPGRRRCGSARCSELALAGTALVEWAWLADRRDRPTTVVARWRPHAARPTAEPACAEVLRYAAPGRAAGRRPFPGCAGPWAAGLRGDWRAAADGWARLGDPYERALELAESGEPGPTVEALHTLEDLGAHAAVRHVRRGCARWG